MVSEEKNCSKLEEKNPQKNCSKLAEKNPQIIIWQVINLVC